VTRFGTFAVLYMMALFLEPAEQWRHPAFTTLLLVLGAVLLAVGVTRRTVAVFLVIATAHALLVDFPDVPNHVNIEIYCSLFLLIAIGYSLARRRQFPTDDDCFELVRPVLQVSMILVYAVAGFDKLNADFLNPEVSCVRAMVGDLARLVHGRTLGVPTALVPFAGLGLVAVGLLSTGVARRPASPAVRVLAFGLILLPALVLLRLAPALPGSTFVIMTMAGVVILWELVGGLLLAVPRFQGPLLAYSWSMHATLSLIGFVHFGALAFALLFTFVPTRYLDLMTSRLRLPILGRAVPRAHAYFALCVLSGLCSGLHQRLAGVALFNLAALVILWPVLVSLAAQAPRPAWPGVSLRNRLTPGWMFVFPLFLLLHGLTSYLGLRTAGNFSMFSNLRTEGARSNHLLLGGNPLKLWGYQEDVVRFISVDDSVATIRDNYQPLQGNQVPVIELKKLIYGWTRAGKTVPMTFEYRGQVYTTQDIVHDPRWRTGARDWRMRLMDFRVIQTEGPNRCRW
jgi:hypothetical protein